MRKVIRELLEAKVCRECLLEESCCEKDYYCEAFQRLLKIAEEVSDFFEE